MDEALTKAPDTSEFGPADFSQTLAQIRAVMVEQNANVNLPRPRTCTRENWPPDYAKVLAWRQMQLARFAGDEARRAKLSPEELEEDGRSRVEHAWEYYSRNPEAFINHWCDTYDPRRAATGKKTNIPFILFPRQVDLIEFILACIRGESHGLIEKARDMGATWVLVCLSVWIWIFWPGAAIGWGSRKQEQVDRIGDPSSLFEKMRMVIRRLPKYFLPKGLNPGDHLFYQRCINPENGSTIVGEIGDAIGRGGRTLMYCVDEAAHLERPELVEASLNDNTNIRIDLSSVSGLGTVFHRKREAGIDWAPGDKIVKGSRYIFVLDWSDHPEKTKEWHEKRRKQAEDDGLLHVHAREVDRDYAAAVEGVIIPQEWARATVDAHRELKELRYDPDTGRETEELLEGWEDGPSLCSLDVADGGMDRNAFSRRKGVVLKFLDQWGARDTGISTRKAIEYCEGHLPVELQYDSVGVGSGVKTEANRLKDDELLPEGIKFVPWSAGAKVLRKNERIIPDDDEAPKNKDFFQNLKAQAWWDLRNRCHKVWRMRNEPGVSFPVHELISIDSDSVEPKLLSLLLKELSQAISGKSTQLKVLVEKAPEGTRSPNLADSVVMNYFPIVVAYDESADYAGGPSVYRD